METPGSLKEKKVDKVSTWPHLVFRELVVVLLACFVLSVISMYCDAPLLEIANPFKTENPAKAPWYFLGLQELLVYFDPWIAGVMIPTLIIFGLMAIPYIDRNPLGNDYYTYQERKFSFWVFTVGLSAWFLLIFIGVYFRGPSWQWYWPGESWDIHKPAMFLKTPLFWQEYGFYVVGLYYLLGFTIPLIIFRNFYKMLGFWRYLIAMWFTLTMFGVFGKIFLRLIFEVKYIIQTPWFDI